MKILIYRCELDHAHYALAALKAHGAIIKALVTREEKREEAMVDRMQLTQMMSQALGRTITREDLRSMGGTGPYTGRTFP